MRCSLLALTLLCLAGAVSAQTAPWDLTLTFRPGTRAQILDAIAYTHGYTDTVPVLDAEGQPVLNPDGTPQTQPNPVSRRTYAEAALRADIHDMVRAYLQQQRAAARAAKAATDAAADKADALAATEAP